MEKEKELHEEELKDQEKDVKDKEDTKPDDNKSYSEEDVQKMLQAETDKRVNQALNTAKEKWQKEMEEKIREEKSEAEKLAKMSEEERNQLELQKIKDEFETQKKQFMKEKMELQTVKELSSNQLPTDFAHFVVADTADQVSENIKTFKAAWEKAIEDAVNEKLKGKTPKVTKKHHEGITKEQFKKMPYLERLKVYQEDPDLYNDLNS